MHELCIHNSYSRTTRSTLPGRGKFIYPALTNSKRLQYFLNMTNTAQSVSSMRCQQCCIDCQRFGKHRNGLRRFRCSQCKKTYTEDHTRMLGGYLSEPKVTMALQLLLEGNSIRSTERITGLRQEHHHESAGPCRREVRGSHGCEDAELVLRSIGV